MKRKKTQRERFEEAVRQTGANQDEAAFDEKLKRIAKSKQQNEKNSNK